MEIIIYNPLTRKNELKTASRISKNMYLGILYKHLDRASAIVKKYEDVLIRTHMHLLNKNVHWAEKKYNNTSRNRLIEASGFRLNSAIKEMDSFALIMRREFYVEIDIDNVKETIKIIIKQVRLGLSMIPSVNYLPRRGVYRDSLNGYYIMRTFLDTKKVKIAPRVKAKKRVIFETEIEDVKPKRKTLEPPSTGAEEEEEFYRGRLFPVQAFLDLPIIINKKRLTNV